MKSVNTTSVIEEDEKLVLDRELSQLMEFTLRMENELGLVLMETNGRKIE
ncbi:MAG: hypothetical protein KJ905_04045 [Nanoarchaeota archaeon]|nr:hypothetical protein [Nanoarchaeota archaeon]MBU2459278.1 hypothetical protein [Nanoarchaeota archaeon]